jgi:branched-chain amino acid transport system substrate-binding protein
MKRTRYGVVAVVGAALVALLAAAFGGAANAAAKQKDPIILGAAIALSGLAEPFDRPPTIGVELAIEDINRRGGVLGRPLRLIKTDFKSDPAKGPDAALQALDRGADILIASCDFDFGSPGARAATDRGVLAISLCASSPLFGPAGISPLAFTAGTAANVQAAAAAEWAHKRRGWRRTYVLEDRTISFTTGWVNDFKQRWGELPGTRVAGSDRFLNSDPSFATVVTRVKQAASRIDFISMCTFPPGGATLVRELRAAGINLPIVSCLAMGGTYWLNAVPNLTNFYTAEQGTAYASARDSNPRVNALLRRYVRKAKAAPPGASYINGYSLVELVARAIRQAGGTDGDDLRQALERFRNVPTIAGPTTFTDKIHIRANPIPYAIMGIRNGKPVFVTRITPSKVPPIRF